MKPPAKPHFMFMLATFIDIKEKSAVVVNLMLMAFSHFLPTRKHGLVHLGDDRDAIRMCSRRRRESCQHDDLQGRSVGRCQLPVGGATLPMIAVIALRMPSGKVDQTRTTRARSGSMGVESEGFVGNCAGFCATCLRSVPFSRAFRGLFDSFSGYSTIGHDKPGSVAPPDASIGFIQIDTNALRG